MHDLTNPYLRVTPHNTPVAPPGPGILVQTPAEIEIEMVIRYTVGYIQSTSVISSKHVS